MFFHCSILVLLYYDALKRHDPKIASASTNTTGFIPPLLLAAAAGWTCRGRQSWQTTTKHGPSMAIQLQLATRRCQFFALADAPSFSFSLPPLWMPRCAG